MLGAVAKFISATHMGMRVNPGSTAASGMGICSTAMASWPSRGSMVVKSNGMAEDMAGLHFLFLWCLPTIVADPAGEYKAAGRAE